MALVYEVDSRAAADILVYKADSRGAAADHDTVEDLPLQAVQGGLACRGGDRSGHGSMNR